MSKFTHVPLAPVDPILGLAQSFSKDPRKDKINLGIGVFRDEKLHTPLLSSVKMAEEALLQRETSKEYLPIDGDTSYLSAIGRLVFGETCWEADHARIACFQTLGGTGALYVGSSFLKEEVKGSEIWIPSPTWPNHRGVFTYAGLHVHTYPYYALDTHLLLFDEILSTLSSLPPLSTVLLHGCCHNPTGQDPTPKQWQKICAVMKERQLIPFFDLAYQGLGDGFNEDAFCIRHALDQELEMLVAVSCSKNFSLYSERVGSLFIVGMDEGDQKRITSRVKQIIRTTYSNPPSFGAKTVEMILNTPNLRTLWEEEVFLMRSRLHEARLQLATALASFPRFSHLHHSKGMFAFLGLTEKEVALLIEKYAIYMPSDGRINVCGLTKHNLEFVVQAICEVARL